MSGWGSPVAVDGFKLKSPTRVGLWRAANNMPGGWMMWLFEQYELNYAVISSLDFEGALSDKYDVIVLPSGTTRSRIIAGLDPDRHDESWRWAHGVASCLNCRSNPSFPYGDKTVGSRGKIGGSPIPTQTVSSVTLSKAQRSSR